MLLYKPPLRYPRHLPHSNKKEKGIYKKNRACYKKHRKCYRKSRKCYIKRRRGKRWERGNTTVTRGGRFSKNI